MEKRLCRGIHYFLAQLAQLAQLVQLVQLALGVDLVPGLERMMVVGVNPVGRVYLMHSLFPVWDDLYSIQQHLFACLDKLPAKGLPPMVEIPE